MRNPAAPKVNVELDKEYTLILDMNAMVAFEEASGKPIHSIGQDMSMKDMRALMWACMLAEAPDITPQEVGRLIHPNNLMAVADKIGKLYHESMPEEEDVPDVDDTAAKTKN